MVANNSLDALDVALINALHQHPRIGMLELARVTGVARNTVTARLQRLEDIGIISGHGPELDVSAAGFEVHAFVILEIAQGAIEDVESVLREQPAVLEAYAITGNGDVLCRVAASSHAEMQKTLVDLNKASSIVRSTSMMVLSEVVPWRTLPLLERHAAATAGRSTLRLPRPTLDQQ